MTVALSEETISDALQTRWLGRHLVCFEEIDSTNEWVKEQSVLDPNLAHGTLVVADFQSQGRGRLDRRWEAPAGTSLLFSLFFRLHWEPERANWLTMLAGLAAIEAIGAQAGVVARLKWPNDIVLVGADGSWRKLGGILLESTWKSGRLVQAVLGMGINVNIPADDLPQFQQQATSLQAETGSPVSRLPLLAQLLGRLEARFDAANAGETPMPAWLDQLILIGERVQVVLSEGEKQSGLLESVDGWGNLLLRDERGDLHAIPAGDVRLRR